MKLAGYDYRQEPRRAEVVNTDPVAVARIKDGLEHDRIVAQKQADWLQRKGLQ